MELEVAVPVPPVDFNFDSACSSPYMTAPSSPQRFGNFFSAPASPTRISAFYRDLSVPFKWEEKPGVSIPTADDGTNRAGDADDEDFEFDFSGQLDRPSLSAADELFDGGKIRPLKLPPRLQTGNSFGGGYHDPVNSNLASPRSPRSRISQGKRIVQEALAMSPRRRKDFEIDPFTTAIEETRKKEENQNQNQNQNHSRGREIRPHNSSNFVRKGTRSLSPMRVSDVVFEPEDTSSQTTATITSSKASNSNSAYSSILSAISFAKDYKKWKLKDLLLFRSASEGRAPRNDDVLSQSKYAVLSRRSTASSEDVRNSSFRSTDSVGSVSSRRRGAPVSAHELHYTANRAVSEEMKKKTFLPYKQGLLGCLGFNPGMHDISRRVGSLSRTG